MKIGLCQLDIAWEDKELNKAKVLEFTKLAVDNQVRLLLFPEMTLTGFSMKTSITAELCRESVKYFEGLAHKYALYIGFGWVEKYLDKARNRYSVVSPEGKLIFDYAKIHPFSYSEEDKYFYGGEELATFRTDEFDISGFICYDLRFPEIFQAVSDHVQLIIVPANWPQTRSEHWRTLLRARAIENQVFVAGVNCVGNKGGLCYSGNSMVVDPEGNIVMEMEEQEGLLIATLDRAKVEQYRMDFPCKKDRKTVFYKQVL
ncbi:carbon-nitrogen family hydrolase [Desulfosporosinus sp. Sb-LF]|uniref:carbon-nitrogen family hydrolase n=1 Tax=Desulfosporosinus sp. Sb-LF TaxID=2560027 RepID=UPI00107F6573|nr:carbon-nitrogen family hydrolase [Desulfosporosinus sp. Sb-LF]TGE33013.1 carbon-nitrogen family hydrolase [Desulfosporosinus sp. Sb-LF]